MNDEIRKLIIPYLEKLGLEEHSDLVLGSDFTEIEDGNLTKLDLELVPAKNFPEDAFTQSTDIEMLNLSGMGLETLPNNIFSPLKKLRILGLRNNNLNNFKPTYFSNNSNLELANLENNGMDEFEIPGVKLIF